MCLGSNKLVTWYIIYPWWSFAVLPNIKKKIMKVKTDNLISGWSKRPHNGFLISWHINPLSGKNSLIFKLLVNNYVFLKDYMLIFFNQYLKPNYFKKHCSSSSFLLTWSRYTSLKWPWSLTWLVPCLKFMNYSVSHISIHP